MSFNLPKKIFCLRHTALVMTLALCAPYVPGAEPAGSWKPSRGFTLTKGDPAAVVPTTSETDVSKAVCQPDHAMAIHVGPGKSHVGGELVWDGRTVGAAETVQIKLLRWVVAPAKPTGWTAVLISLRNDAGCSLNVNLASADYGFISASQPDWKKLGGDFNFVLPVSLTLARKNGKVAFAMNGREILSVDDDAAHPYNTLAISSVLETPGDSLVAAFGPPVIGPEKPAVNQAK